MIYYLDLALYESFGHEYLQRIFPFPTYYGKNLDAFYDAMSELPACFVALSHTEAGEESKKLLRVLTEIHEEYPHIQLLQR